MPPPAYVAAVALFERSKGCFPHLTDPPHLNVAALLGAPATVLLADILPKYPDVAHVGRGCRWARISPRLNTTTSEIKND